MGCDTKIILPSNPTIFELARFIEKLWGTTSTRIHLTYCDPQRIFDVEL